MAKWKRVTIAELAADVAEPVSSLPKPGDQWPLPADAKCSSTDQTEQPVAESYRECTNSNPPYGWTVAVTFLN